MKETKLSEMHLNKIDILNEVSKEPSGKEVLRGKEIRLGFSIHKNTNNFDGFDYIPLDSIKEIARLLNKKIIEKEKADEKKGRIPLTVSITGILSRIYEPCKGTTLRQIRNAYDFPLKEFVKNFEMAKRCAADGDLDNLRKFFNLYS